jgi:hypothetical protein
LHGMQEVGGSIPPGSTTFARFASYGWAGQLASIVAKLAKAAPP